MKIRWLACLLLCVAAGPLWAARGRAAGPGATTKPRPTRTLQDLLARVEDSGYKRVWRDADGEVVRLSLGPVDKLSDPDLVALAGLPRLRELRLKVTSPAVSEHGLARLADLRQLRTLNLNGSEFDGPAALLAAASIAELEELHLDGVKVSGRPLTDAHMAMLGTMPSLKVLSLSHSTVGGAGLERLQGAPRIQVLNLLGTVVSGDDMRHVAALGALRMLRVSSPHLDDKGVGHLSGSRSLELLLLDSDRMTDSGVLQLSKLSTLRWLRLGGRNVTREVRQGLRNIKPELDVKRLGDGPSTAPAER